MTKKEILDFINSNLPCYLATAEGNQPHLRGMMAYSADESGIIFHTGNMKELYLQIKSNPLVEVCFLSQKGDKQVRVKGEVVINDDLELKKEIVEARPFLQPWVEEMGYEMLVVFQVINCVACVWTFENNFAPKEYIKLYE